MSDVGLPPITQSEAYQQFSLRPYNDLSVLIYLIDRFRESPAEIRYGEAFYRASFAAVVARWFLNHNYGNQTVREWILRWCNTSVPDGKLIWVRYPDGRFKLAREILLEAYEKLKEQAAADGLVPEEGDEESEGLVLKTPAYRADNI